MHCIKQKDICPGMEELANESLEQIEGTYGDEWGMARAEMCDPLSGMKSNSLNASTVTLI